jgi:hypothetical protein
MKLFEVPASSHYALIAWTPTQDWKEQGLN